MITKGWTIFFKAPPPWYSAFSRLLEFELHCLCLLAQRQLNNNRVRVRVRFDLPAAIRAVQHVHSVWQSPSLGCRTKPRRDLDSNKEHERTMCSWFQQIGWTCKEANMGLCSCWTVSAVGKWPREEEDETYRGLVSATLSVSGGDFRLQNHFFGEVEKRSVKMTSDVSYMGSWASFFHNWTSSVGHSRFTPSHLQSIYIVSDCQRLANELGSHFIPLNTERESIERTRLTLISLCTVLWKALRGLVGWC